MPRDLEHLELRRVQGTLPRRLHGGGSTIDRADRAQHGHRLRDEAEGIVQSFQQRPRRPGIEPALIFKVELDRRAYLDDDRLERMGLQVLARDPNKTLVVFTSDEDLTAFRRQLRSYSGDAPGPAYAELGGIERLVELGAADRVGRRLEQEPLDSAARAVPLDVELWHPGTRRGAERTLDQLMEVVATLGGRVTDQVIGADLLLARVRLDASRLDALLDVDPIREIDRIPQPGIAPTFAELATIEDLPEIAEPVEGSPGVLVVDSGITANHPLLAPLVGDAAAFPGPSTIPAYGPQDTEQVMGGHGTAVAGIAGLGSLAAIAGGQTADGVRLFSARVLDDECRYDPDELVEHQLEQVLDHFLEAYPECRVINLSLGDDRLIASDGGRQFRIAARVDELAYELQDRNILFVISSGNRTYVGLRAGDEIRLYPEYLLEPRARVIEPATSALALTVGGLAAGEESVRVGHRAVAGRPEFPSPFTRTGPGVGGMLKPDVVELAGDAVLDAAGDAVDDDSVGVLTTNRAFGPPQGRLLRQVRGTSFAAPAVAHLAARLFAAFPDATPNLIRALIADSAQVPEERPQGLDGQPWEERIWRIYGHGRPSLERAMYSAENDVLLVAESSIELDAYQLFEIPELPTDFLARPGRRLLSVSLAFDPPSRQSRGDSYLGVTMQFRLFRNTTLDAIEGIFRDWSRAPAGPSETALESRLDDLPGSAKIDLRPGVNLRGKGTLQRGVLPIVRSNWSYDGGPLVLAVTSQRTWAPEEVVSQRFAVVASLKHSDPAVRLHERLRLRLRPRVRLRSG